MRDSEIIGLYNSRNEKAIEESDKKYGAYCFAVAKNILSSREDSEECVSDTWLRAWNVIPPKCPEILRLFFAKITRRMALDVIKRESAAKRGSGELCAVLEELEECITCGKTVEDELDEKLLANSLEVFLKSVSERERVYFLRRYFYAEAVTDIAKRYGISANTVSVTLSRTRAKLRAYLKKEGYQDDSI